MRLSQHFKERILAGVLIALASALGVRLPVRDIAAPRETLTGVADIVDGDSLRLSGRDIRLQGVDAPELRQECERNGRIYSCGREARRALATLAGNSPITCDVKGLDWYGRSLATCRSQGVDMGQALISKGHALAYGDYIIEEAKARDARTGLWAGKFERPSDWRQRHAAHER